MKSSIPSGLMINERSRLLAYLKVKYPAGFFHKSDLGRLCRIYGKDPRTITTHLKGLLNSGLIGEDQTAYYLRSWKFITGKELLNTQAFKASLDEIKEKEIFEGLLFSAKVTSIQKAFQRGKSSSALKGDARIKECFIPAGFLSGTCGSSVGKVTKLKRIATALGYIDIEKSFEDHGLGTQQSARILRSEVPGIFLKEGRLKRRKADQVISKVETFRIKNRKKNEKRTIHKT